MLRFRAQLRVWSTVCTLTEIENVLGAPSKGHSIGDEYSRGKKTRTESLWALKSSLERGDTFEAHLNQLIDFLDEHCAALANLKNSCEETVLILFMLQDGIVYKTCVNYFIGLKKISSF